MTEIGIKRLKITSKVNYNLILPIVKYILKNVRFYKIVPLEFRQFSSRLTALIITIITSGADLLHQER